MRYRISLRRHHFIRTGTTWLAILAVAFTGLPLRAPAAEFTWQGNTGNWSDPLNWGGVLPLGDGTDVLVFEGSGMDSYVATNDFLVPDPFNPHQFRLNSASLATSTLDGNALTFSGADPAILQQGFGAFAIANDIQLNTDLRLGGDGWGLVTLAGELSSPAGLLKTGSSSFLLTGQNSYAGATTIDGGHLLITNQQALGAGSDPVVVNAAHERAAPGANLTLAGGWDSTFSFDRALALNGGGIAGNDNLHTPVGGPAFSSLGQTLVTGDLQISPDTTTGSHISSHFGTLTLTGAVALNQSLLIGGRGQTVVQGQVVGAGGLVKTGLGGLALTHANNTFAGMVDVRQGSLRVSDAGQLGTHNTIRVSGGTLELRSDNLVGFESKSILPSNSGTSTLAVDRAVGGAALNQTVEFDTFSFVAASRNLTINTRNGHGVRFSGSPAPANINGTVTLRVDGSGTATFAGDLYNNTQTATARQLIIRGTGNTVIEGSILAADNAAAHFLTKTDSGTLTILGTESKLTGRTNISNGTLVIQGLGALGATDGPLANTDVINIGSGSSTGQLVYLGSGETLSRTINLAGTNGNAILHGSGSGALVIESMAVTAGTASHNAKVLVLTGTSHAGVLNELQAGLTDNPAGGTVSLAKRGSNTWVLSGANSYTGNTTITDGRLALKATSAAATVLSGGGAIVFGDLSASTSEAGGTLEYIGHVDGSHEQLGILSPVAGMGTIRLTRPDNAEYISLMFAGLDDFVVGSISASHNIISSVGTGGSGGSLNFVTPETGTNGVDYTFMISGQMPGFFGDGRVYFNGGNFAYTDDFGFIRGMDYGLDSDAVSSAITLTADVHNEITGDVATDEAIQIRSLKISGGHTLSLGGNLTINTGNNTSGGIIAGGGDASITGSGLLTDGTGALALNVVGASDTLTLEAPLLANTRGFIKNGAGTLIIAGQNAQTGTNNINEGTLMLAAGGRLSAASSGLNIRQGATLDLNGVDTGNAIGRFSGAGTVTNRGETNATLTIGNGVTTSSGNGAGTFSGILQDGDNGGALNVTVMTHNNNAAQFTRYTFSGQNTYTGVTTLMKTTVARNGNLVLNVTSMANLGEASGIGRGNLNDNAGSLVFHSAHTGLNYIGSESVSIDRLFTFAGTSGAGSVAGARIMASGANDATIVWNNSAAIAFANQEAQTLSLGGTSTGDNQFNPLITDNPNSVFAATSLLKTDAGLWILGNENNTYSGLTTIAGGALRANDGGSLPFWSGLELTGGVLETHGVFDRDLSEFPDAGSVTWTGSGGFAASTDRLVVAIGGTESPDQLIWGAGGFVGDGNNLVLGSSTALADVELVNHINLNGGDRTVQVNRNANTAFDFATLSGNISNSAAESAGLIKTGLGRLQLLGHNTYDGDTHIRQGELLVQSIGGSGVASSSLGSGDGSLLIGNAGTTGTLIYVGDGEIADRAIHLQGTTGGAVFDASGANRLVLTNVLVTGEGAKTLTLQGDNAGLNAITSDLADSGGALTITKNGAGTWVLAGDNSGVSGPVNITGGMLGVGHDNALGTGTISASLGNLMAVGGPRVIANDVTHGNTFGIGGADDINFAGIWTLTSNRILTVNNSALTEFSGEVRLSSSATTRTLTLRGEGDVLFSGVISNGQTASSGHVTHNGTGVATLAAENTYTGTTRVNAGGTMVVTGAGTLSPGALNVNAGALLIQGDADQTVGRLTMGAGPAGSSSLIDIGADRTLTVDGVTFSATNHNLTAVVSGAGTLHLLADGDGIVDVNIASSNQNDIDMSWEMDTLTGSGTFLKRGAGTLDIRGVQNNLFDGSYQVTAGQLLGLENLANNLILNGGVYADNGLFDRALGDGDNQVQWAAGAHGGFAAVGGDMTVNLGGASDTLVWDVTPFFVSDGGNLLFGSTSADGVVEWQNNIDLNGGARTINVADNNGVDTDWAVITGQLIGDANSQLTKIGLGRLVLAGNNENFFGDVVISGNSPLQAAHDNALGIGGTVTLTGTNARLDLADGVTIANNLVVANSGNQKYLSVLDTAATATFAGQIENQEASSGNFRVEAVAGSTLHITGDISSTGGGGMRKLGEGLVVLHGANSYAGVTYLGSPTEQGGELQLVDNAQLPDSTSITIYEGVLNITDTVQEINTLTIGLIAGDLEGHVVGTGSITALSTASSGNNLNFRRGSLGPGVDVGGINANVNSYGGEFVFSGHGIYTGNTTLSNGATLILDYTEDNRQKLPANNFNLSGGRVTLNGNALAASYEEIGTTALTNGFNTLTLNDGGAGLTMNLGNITRGTAAGVLQIFADGAGVGTGQVVTRRGNDTSGIVGPWLLYGDHWAVADMANPIDIGGTDHYALTPFAGYTAQNDAAQFAAGDHVSSTAAFTGAAGNVAVNTIRFDAATDSTLLIDDDARLRVAGQGILFTSATGGFNSTITGGLLITGNSGFGNGADLVINNLGGGNVEIASDLYGYSAAVTVVGDATLSGTNRYRGNTRITDGVLTAGSGDAIGDRSNVYLTSAAATGLTLDGVDLRIGGISGGSTSSGEIQGLIDIGDNTLTTTGVSSLTYSGNIVGTGTFIKAGVARQHLGADVDFAGDVIVSQGELRVQGSSIGSLQNITELTVKTGGSLYLAHTGNNTNRIPDEIAVHLSGSGIGSAPAALYYNNATNGNRFERIGETTLVGGHVAIAAGTSHSSSSAALARLEIADLIRSADRATLFVAGRNLGFTSAMMSDAGVAGTGRVVVLGGVALFGGDGGAGETNISILPWAVGSTVPATNTSGSANLIPANSLVTHDGTHGFRALDLNTEYVLNVAGYNASADPTDNLRFTESAGGLAGKTFNALVVDTSNGPVTLTGAFGESLTLSSGALLIASDTPSQTATIDGFANLAVGATNEYVVTVQTNTATIASNLNSASADLTKAGEGSLILTADNLYGGATTINQGAIQVDALSRLGTGGAIRLFGGTLAWADGAAFDASTRTLHFGEGNAGIDIGAADVTFAHSVGDDGAGGLHKLGEGTLTLLSTNTYTGATIISEGTLSVSELGNEGAGPSQLGHQAADFYNPFTGTRGSVRLDGGTLQYTGAGETTNRTLLLTAASTFDHQGGHIVFDPASGPAIYGHGNTNLTVTGTGGGTILGDVDIGSSALWFVNTGTWNIHGMLSGHLYNYGADITVHRSYAVSRNLILGRAAGETYLHLGNTQQEIEGTLTIFGSGSGYLSQADSRVEVTGNGTISLAGNVTVSNTNSPLGATIEPNIHLGDSTRTFSVANSNNSNAELELLGVVSGAPGVGITKTSSGTLVLSGVNTYDGVTRIDAGAIRAEFGVGFSDDTHVLLNGGVWESNGTFTGALGDGGGQVSFVEGSNGGFSAHGGDFNINIGGDGDALLWGATEHFVSDGANLILGSTSADSATRLINALDLNGQDRTISVLANPLSDTGRGELAGNLIGSNRLTKAGAGVLSISADNSATFDGDITVSGGTLRVEHNQALGSAAVTITNTNSRLELTDGITIANNIVVANPGNQKFIGLASGTAAVGVDASSQITVQENSSTGYFRVDVGSSAELTINSTITSTAGTGFYKTGDGTLYLTADNNITSNFRISAGTVQFVTPHMMRGHMFFMDLEQSSGAEIAGEFWMNGNRNVTVNPGTNADIELTISANIGQNNADSSGTNRNLTKLGAGTLLLTGNNTYGGTTVVNDGTLILGSAGAVGGSSGIIISGAAANLGVGTHHTLPSITINGVGTVTLDPLGQGPVVLFANNLVQTAGNGLLVVRGNQVGAGEVDSSYFLLQGGVETDVLNALVGGNGAAGSRNISIMGSAVGGASSADPGSTFLTYTTDNGFRPLAESELANGLTAGNAGMNVTAAGGETVDQSLSVNALRATGGVTTVTAGADLQIASGALLFTDSATVEGSGTLSFGTQKGFITVANEQPSTVMLDTAIHAADGLSINSLGTQHTVVLNNANLIAGQVGMGDTTVRVGHDDAFNRYAPAAVAMTTGAQLQLAGHEVFIRNLAGVSGTVVANQADTDGTLRLYNTGTGRTAFAGVLLDGDGNGVLHVVKEGTGVLDLTAGNSTYTGTTTIRQGTIELRGSWGRINFTESVHVEGGGVLLLTNTTSSSNRQARVNDDAPIYLNAGMVDQNTTNNSALNYSELFGDLVVGAGQNYVRNEASAGSNTSVLTFNSLTQAGDGLITFTNRTDGGNDVAIGSVANNHIVFTDAPELVNGIIGARAFLSHAVSGPGAGDVGAVDFATHDGDATSVRAFSDYHLGDSTTWTNSTVARVSEAAFLSDAAEVYALKLEAGLDLAFQSLDVTSGAIIHNSPNIDSLGFGLLTSASGELIFYTDNNNSGDTTNLIVEAMLTDHVDGAVSVVKSGADTLTLADFSNQYTGSTSVLGGTLTISLDGNLGIAPEEFTPGHLRLYGGSLGTTTLNFQNEMELNSNRGIEIGGREVHMQGVSGQTVTYNGHISSSQLTNLVLTGDFDMTFNDSIDLGGSLQLFRNRTLLAAESVGSLISLTGVHNAIGGGLTVGSQFGQASFHYHTVGGTLTVGLNRPGMENFHLGVLTVNGSVPTDDPTTMGIMDLTGTANFIAHVDHFRVGVKTGTTNSTAARLARGILTLAENNEIYAASGFVVGASTGTRSNQPANFSRVTFGAGDNMVTTPLFVAGGQRGNGEVIVSAGGTLNISGIATGSADLYVANNADGHNHAHADFIGLGLLDASQATLVADVNTLGVGLRTLGTLRGGGANGQLLMGNSADNHIVANSLLIGIRDQGTAGANTQVTGLVEFGGGLMHVRGDAVLASFTNTNDINNASTTGTLHIDGGQVQIDGDAVLGHSSGHVTPGDVSVTALLNLTGGQTTILGNIITTDHDYVEATLAMGGGSLDMTGGTIVVHAFEAQSGTLSNVEQIFQRDGATALDLVKSSEGSFTLDGVNTFTGGIEIEAGTVSVAAATAFGAGSATVDFTGEGGVLHFAESLTTSRGATFQFDATFDVDAGQHVEFDSAAHFAGSAGFTKTGDGVMRMTDGSYTFDGPVTVDAGQLVVGGNLNGHVTVHSGGRFSHAGQILGSVTINSGGADAAGTSVGISHRGDTTWEADARVEWELAHTVGTAGVQWDLLHVDGILTVNATLDNPVVIDVLPLAGALDTFDAFSTDFQQDQGWLFVTAEEFVVNGSTLVNSGFVDGFGFDATALRQVDGFQLVDDESFAVYHDLPTGGLYVSYSYVAVPEPGSMVLVGLGALGMAGFGWRRRRKQQHAATRSIAT